MSALRRACALACLAAPAARAQAPQQIIGTRYDVDGQHSAVAFTIRMLRVVKVHGRFLDYQGAIVYDPADPEGSSVTAVITANSIDTDMEFRDNHLRSPDFFDATRYPLIEFQSTRVARRGAALVATGPFTMHGVTRIIELPVAVVLEPDTVPASGTVRVAFESQLRLSRRDFGIAGTNTFNPSYNPATTLLSDSVDVELTLYAEQPGYANRTFSGRTPPSIADTVSRILDARGTDDAVRLYRALRADSSAVFAVSAGQLDALGHKLIAQNRLPEAIAVLALNEEFYPLVNGVSQSVADAYARAGDRARAVAGYRRALAVDSTNAAAIEMLRRLDTAPQNPRH
jgi:polyisoprenoid-binding protein YceI